MTQSKTIIKNAQGQTVSVTDAASKVIADTYDPFGSLITTDAAGIVTSLTYDLRGRKTAMADPDMGNWTYEYDALGQLRLSGAARIIIINGTVRPFWNFASFSHRTLHVLRVPSRGSRHGATHP